MAAARAGSRNKAMTPASPAPPLSPATIAGSPPAGRIFFDVHYGSQGFKVGQASHTWRFDGARYDLSLTLEAKGLALSGTSPDGSLVEMIELPGHPYFVATQAHPEFKSQPLAPHPLFAGLVGAAVKHAAAR